MTSATERLRALLTERGVEYELTAWSCGAAVWWRDSNGAMWRAHDNEIDELLSLYVLNSLTPEQAIDATLGRGTCEVEGFDDGIDEGMDGEWFAYAPPTWHLSCGHEVCGSERPRYCSVCGKRVVEP